MDERVVGSGQDRYAGVVPLERLHEGENGLNANTQ